MLRIPAKDRPTGKAGTECEDYAALRQQILANFESSSYRQLRSIEVCVDNLGVVELRGKMDSYFLKQVAYRAVIDLPGVFSVKDLITVIHTPTS